MLSAVACWYIYQWCHATLSRLSTVQVLLHILCYQHIKLKILLLGSLNPENFNFNASATISLTCSAICGSIKWHINGRVVSSGSLVDGLYEVHRVSSVCSASFDPVGCPQCGCSNCNSLRWPTSQTFNSTITMAANESVIVDCMSEQKYPHQSFSVLRKRYNLKVIKSKQKLSAALALFGLQAYVKLA